MPKLRKEAVRPAIYPHVQYLRRRTKRTHFVPGMPVEDLETERQYRAVVRAGCLGSHLAPLLTSSLTSGKALTSLCFRIPICKTGILFNSVRLL